MIGRSPLDVLADLDAAALRSVAAETAVGMLYVSLLHGDLETRDDVAKLQLLRDLIDRTNNDAEPGHPVCIATRGGNDWTTWCLLGPTAPLLQTALLGRIGQIAPSWWRWSTDGRPPRSLSEGTGPAKPREVLS